MNILITVHSYYPSKDGVQFVTEYHAENLVKLGHKVTVVTLNRGSNIEQETYNGVDIIRFNAWVKHSFYYGDKKKYQNLILDLSKKTDVLINVCTQCPTTDWVLPILSKISCKKILYLHGMHNFTWSKMDVRTIGNVAHKIWNNLRWFFLYATNKSKFLMYDRVVQLHEFVYGNLFFEKKYGIKATIIENAAEDSFFDNAESVEEKYIICVANYIEGKNQKFILEAFYKANLDNDISLIFVGSKQTDYFKTLLKVRDILQEKYGVKKIYFLTGLTREETVEKIKKASVFAMGSKKEMFPISIIEAMAAGVPFISTDVGCVKYLPGGVIVENEREMAYWFKLFFQNEDLRCSTGLLGRNYARKYLTISSKTKELDKIIRD